jgi:hypothetical protein
MVQFKVTYINYFSDQVTVSYSAAFVVTPLDKLELYSENKKRLLVNAIKSRLN